MGIKRGFYELIPTKAFKSAIDPAPILKYSIYHSNFKTTNLLAHATQIEGGKEHGSTL